MMLLHAWAEAPNYEQVRGALEWLFDEITFPESAFLGVEVFQAADDPHRVAYTERWTSLEDFLKVAVEVGYTEEVRAEFLARAGIAPESVTRQIWVKADHPAPRTA